MLLYSDNCGMAGEGLEPSFFLKAYSLIQILEGCAACMSRVKGSEIETLHCSAAVC